MTREEFWGDVNEWGDLLSFCCENTLEACNDIYNYDEVNARIRDDVYDYLRDNTWEDLRDELDDVEGGYEYYQYRGEMMFDFIPCDDEMFERYKQYADEEMDWEEEEEDLPDEDDDGYEESDISIDDLMSISTMNKLPEV